MKKLLIALFFFSALLVSLNSAISADPPKPFGLVLDQATYEDVLNQFEQRSWHYDEFERKGYAPVKKNSSRAGRNTFLRVKPREMEGLRILHLFFNDNKKLEAVLAGLEPQVLPDVKIELNRKYELVKDSLMNEDSSVSYAYVLRVGSVIIMEFDSAADAQNFADNDPYNKAGLFESVSIRPWKKVLP